MQKAVELALKMSKDLASNWRDHLELINLHNDFAPVYGLGYSQTIANTIVAFIILSYDNDSSWIDINKDRVDNQEKNLLSLHAAPTNEIYREILLGENKEVSGIITEYLINQCDYRWQEIMSCFDFAARMIRYCNSPTDKRKKVDVKLDTEGVNDTYEENDIETINKVNKSKGELLMKAIESRQKGQELLEQLRKDFVKLDTITQSEFDYNITDTAKEDIYSWKQFIRKMNQKKAATVH